MKASNSWMSISDLMTVLMLIFMFITIIFMVQVDINNKKIQQVAKTYEKDKLELNKDLKKEFNKDLKKWDAEITKNNNIIFNSPDVLFKRGESIISPKFEYILQDFFPRYLQILTSKKYKNEIDEIRVEGHTSNIWKSASTKEEAYLKNMQLSQERANNVLSYCYSINNKIVIKNRNWLESHFRANGMAFAKLKYKKNNKPDNMKSRRVEFKSQMKTEQRIYKILEVIQ